MQAENNNIVKEYISLAIDEKVSLKENYLASSFNKNLSQNLIIQKADEYVKFKKNLDQIIQDLVEEYGNKKELKKPDIRTQLVDQIYSQLPADLIEAMKTVLQNKQDNPQDAAVDPNLILSEIFVPEGETPEEEPEKEPKDTETQPQQKQSLLQLSKIRQNFWTYDYKKINTKKLIAFYEFLKNYDFKLKFESQDKDSIQGALLLTIHSNDKSFNSLIFKKFFREFIENFTNFFINDFEAEIDSSVLFVSCHFILICSYNKKLCQYLDKAMFFEQISENFLNIRQEHFSIFIKIFINFMTLYPVILDKIISLRIINKLAEKMMPESNINTLALFFILLNKISKLGIQPKIYFDKNHIDYLLKTLLKIFVSSNDLRILSLKQKENPTNFKPYSPTDPYLLSQLYKKTYKKMIEEQCPLEKYDEYNMIAFFILKFFSKSFKILEDFPQRNDLVKYAFNLVNMFFYQKQILRYGLLALVKLMSRENIMIYKEEIFETEFFYNIFTVFERSQIDLMTIPAIINFQTLVYLFLETLQLNEEFLHTGKIQFLFNYVYKIREIVDDYFITHKKKYLQNGFLKYARKITNSEFELMIQKLNHILSQNGIILQKLSHTHNLETNMSFEIMECQRHSFYDGGKLVDKKQIIENIQLGLRIIYITSKVDRKSEYLDQVNNFNEEYLEKLKKLLEKIYDQKKLVDFQIIYKILDYMILNLYFLKTQDEKLSRQFTLEILKKLLDHMTFIFINAKYFIDLNQNYQIYIILENFNLFWYLFFNFDLKFFDRKEYIFLENIYFKTKDNLEQNSNRFEEETIYKILNFLNTLMDVKNKDIFINFMILKQLDIIYNSINLSIINEKFLFSIFRKALEKVYSKDIHKISPSQLLNFSTKLLVNEQSNSLFVQFIFLNKLFYNDFIAKLLRTILDKNYKFENIEKISQEEIAIINFTVKKITMEDNPKIIQFLFNQAQLNINHQNLFSDIIVTVKRHFKLQPSEHHKKTAIQLFTQTNIFNKLVKLYKKDKINLSKIFKNLLIIAKNYDLFKQITIPERIIASLLKTNDIWQFEDVYIYILEYILAKGLYGDFQEGIDIFFRNIKNYLDHFLFFSNHGEYDQKLQTIYYSLKILSHSELLAPNLIKINISEYILKYSLQLFNDNYKLELTPVNNLYQYFNKYFVEDSFTPTTFNFERKIVKLFIQILNNEKNEFEDFFVLNKILCFCYYIVDIQPYESLKLFYKKTLIKGLSSEKENIFKNNFYDFYFVLFYRYFFQDEEIIPIIEKYLNQCNYEECIGECLTFIKKLKQGFDDITYNELIRNCLKIHYIISCYGQGLSSQSYFSILKILSNFFKDHYEQIHKITKFEKLVVEIFLLISKTKKATSLVLASSFLEIFTKKSDFLISSDMDKFIYMGLFNTFFKNTNKKLPWQLNELQVIYQVQTEEKNKLKEIYKKMVIDQQSLNQIVKQLTFKNLSDSEENILLEFFENISIFVKEFIQQLEYNKDAIQMQQEKILVQLNEMEKLQKIKFQFLIKRIRFQKYCIEFYINNPQNENIEKFLENCENIKNLLVKMITTLKDEKEEDIKIEEENLNEEKEKKEEEEEKKEPEQKKEEKIELSDKLNFILHSINYIRKYYILLSKLNRSSVKKEILENFNQLYQLNEQAEEKNLAINCIILRNLVKLMKNVYDEVRIFQQENFIKKIFEIFSSEHIENLNQAIKEKFEKKSENEGEENEKENKESVYSELEESSQAKKSEIKTPLNENNQPEEKEIIFFKDENDLQTLFEYILYIFTQVSKNRLILEQDYKKELYQKIKGQKYLLKYLPIIEFLNNKLKEEYDQQGMVYFNEQETEGVMTNIQRKEKNILYIHKIFETIQKNLNEKKEITPKEQQFLQFGLEAMKKQLKENLDAEIFANLNLIPIICDFFLSEKIEILQKIFILDLLQEFFDITQKNNRVEPEKIEKFCQFYETLIDNNFPEAQQKYFILLQQIIQLVNMREEYINEIFDKITTKIFKEKKEIESKVFYNTLSLYCLILRKFKITYEFDKIVNPIYNYIQINNRTLKLEEKALFAQIVVHLKIKTKSLDKMKFQNLIVFLKLIYKDENLASVKKTLIALDDLTTITDDYHLVLKELGFEILFKIIVKKYGAKFTLAELLGNLFLKYSSQLSDKKREVFQMFETLKNILNYIDFYYTLEERKLVLTYYKCLVNGSKLKSNAEYLINSNLSKTITKCFYENDKEFYLIVISLLFNITYVFYPNEVDLKELFTPGLIQKTTEIYQISLQNGYEEILGEIIDLLVSLISHDHTEIFTLQLITQIKLTLNFYYNNEIVLAKFLTILKDLSVSDKIKTKSLLKQEFDYVYLYHLHFSNLKNQKINSLIKHLIYNLIKIDQEKNQESDLVLFGIPENIIFTFSLTDDADTILINLKLIHYSIQYEKCMFFVKNNFIIILKKIVLETADNIQDESKLICLDILYDFLQFFSDPNLFYSFYYFNDLIKLFNQIPFYETREKYCFVILSLIKALLANKKESAELLEQKHKDFLKNIVKISQTFKNPEKIVEIIFDINKLLEIQQIVTEKKYDLFNFTEKLSTEEKIMLEQGQKLHVMYENNIQKQCTLKFDFVKMVFLVSRLNYKEPKTGEQKTKMIFQIKDIEKIDEWSQQELNNFEENFKKMQLKPKLPVSQVTKLMRRERDDKGDIRGGTRGGKNQFNWEDLRDMSYKDRECYLGYTAKIGYLDKGGKWRKGDWIQRNERKRKIEKEKLKEKMEEVKKQDQKRMEIALGLRKKEEKREIGKEKERILKQVKEMKGEN